MTSRDFLTQFQSHQATPPPIGLQLLCMEPFDFETEAIVSALKELHPTLAHARVEWHGIATLAIAAQEVVKGEGPPATHLGLISWGEHTIKIVGFSSPMPPGPVSATLGHSLFVPPNMKSVGEEHQSHLLLEYAGKSSDTLDRYVALAVVALALYPIGAVVTLNEEARAAVPTSALYPEIPGEDLLESLRKLPLPYLYGGFVKIELSDPPDAIWYRTFANSKFGLPELSLQGKGHGAFTETFQLFSSMLEYLRSTGIPLEIGETVRVDEDRYFVAREPKPEQWWLDADGVMVVLEPG